MIETWLYKLVYKPGSKGKFDYLTVSDGKPFTLTFIINSMYSSVNTIELSL